MRFVVPQGLGWLILMLPLSSHAATAWCPVPAADAETRVTPVTQSLAPLLDSDPLPMAHVHTEGTLLHQGIRDQSVEAERRLFLMQDAALAWRAGAGEPYLKLAERDFTSWVAVYQPDFNPIDETSLDTLFETYGIIGSRLDKASDAAARSLFRTWAEGYIAAIAAHPVAATPVTNWNNNWQSHRIKIITLIAVALDDDALFAEARRLFQAQIDVNVGADGEVTDFAVRDGLHYVVYDAEPLTRAALAARARGEDWFNYQSPHGGSLAKVFKWLEPYATGEKTHEEFVHSTISFDAQRAAAGEKGYSGLFDPTTAGDVYWMASQFDAHYRALAQRLKPVAPVTVSLCGT